MTKYPARVLLYMSVCLALILSTGWTGSASAQAGQPAFGDQRVYLPLMAMNTGAADVSTLPAYSGNITYRNAPVAGQQVQLLNFDGVSWSIYATTVTDVGGNYQFPSLPPLTWTSKYYVRWNNTAANLNWLSYWACDVIDIYKWRTASFSCSFDIENVFLISPLPGQTYGLPQTFRWEFRTNQPGDVYALNIADMSDFDPWWYDAHSPGYVDTFIMFTRPRILDTNTWYGWFVTVEGLNGFGASNVYHAMIFTGPHVLSVGDAGALPASLQEAAPSLLR